MTGVGTALVLALAAAPPAAAPRWPLLNERLIAADAASYAPPDLKRLVTRFRKRYMAGINDAVAAETHRRTPAEHRAAAARGARLAAAGVREHRKLEDVVYELGGVVHEAAAAFAPAAAFDPATLRGSRFAGFGAAPFADPEKLAVEPLPSSSPVEAHDAAVTLATRLFAWTWKTAGGDAGIVKEYPQGQGPYVVRE